MRRICKNIWRLPQIYLPLFLSCALIATLILLGGAVRNSCRDAIELLKTQYDVSLTVSLKARNEKVLGEDGKARVINRNERLLDAAVLSLLEAQRGLGEMHYPVNSFFIPLDVMCTDEEYHAMRSGIAAGDGFFMPSRVYFTQEREVYDVGIYACTDWNLAAETLDCGEEELFVTYFDEHRFGDGVILPRALYDLYGAPDQLVIGWYTENVSGLDLGDMQTGASVTDRISSIMEDMAQMPAPPTVVLDVIGVYETDTEMEVLKILTTPDIWNNIWRTYDYYQTRTELGWHALRPDANAWNDLGVQYVTCRLDAPSEAASVIASLMDAGLSSADFSIVAEDYEYKFALSQIAHVATVAEVLYGCALAFGVLSLLLLLRYAIRRRGGEIFTRRTLGERGGVIALTLAAEIFAVLLLAYLAAIGMSEIAGRSLCNAVWRYMQRRAENAVDNLSAITEFMKDSAQIKAQLHRAMQAYQNSNITLRYAIPQGTLWWLAGCISGACGVSMLFALPTLKTNLMKRGDTR
jgi:hypothetical protein